LYDRRGVDRVLEGKVAIVTGAASGIGAATAQLLASEGATVVGLDIAPAEEVRTCDVTDRAQVDALVAEVVAAHAGIDILANVAGMIRFGHFADLTQTDWQRQLDVNVTGPFNLCQAALPSLLERRGCIVNVASVAGLRGQAYSGGYCASKGALVMLTRALAVELAAGGVRVNCVCPGTVLTPLIVGVGDALPADVDASLMARLNGVMPGLIEPGEIAEAIAYLASDAARSVTGAALAVDLGVVA
jgi:NAD(P)-dependent dehydrogenase (short-subunit alcohol dehydrogenase family)